MTRIAKLRRLRKDIEREIKAAPKLEEDLTGELIPDWTGRVVALVNEYHELALRVRGAKAFDELTSRVRESVNASR